MTLEEFTRDKRFLEEIIQALKTEGYTEGGTADTMLEDWLLEYEQKIGDYYRDIKG